jgi:hypothetical protein
MTSHRKRTGFAYRSAVVLLPASAHFLLKPQVRGAQAAPAAAARIASEVTP